MNYLDYIIENPAVCVCAATDYEIETMEEAVDFHFEKMDYAGLLNKKSSVLIKPNLLLAKSYSHNVITNPYLILAICNKLKKLGVENVTIADSPGGLYSPEVLKNVYSICGYKTIAEKYSLNLNYDTSVKTVIPENYKSVSAFSIISPIADADVVINVSKLKTHGMMLLSGAVKNMFGSIPGLKKPEYHFRFPDYDAFSNMLIDLCVATKPVINFMDAVESLEGNGPTTGMTKKTDLLLSSYNPFSLDYAASSVAGFNFDEVFTLKNSIERGFCSENLDDVEIIGDKALIKNFKFILPKSKLVDFASIKIIPKFVKKAMVPRPKIIKKFCVGCGKCIESCPAKIIELDHNKAVIETLNKCIHCFCCHEMCKYKAIDIKRFILFK